MALVALTIVSVGIAEGTGAGGDVVTVIVILAGAVKCRVILRYFMGMRSFPVPWRLFFDGWLLVNAAIIIGFHLLGD